MWQLWSAGVLAFVSTTVGFTLLGAWYDRWQGTSPWGVVAGIVLGWAVGLYELYQVFRILSRRQSSFRTKKDRGDPQHP